MPCGEMCGETACMHEAFYGGRGFPFFISYALKYAMWGGAKDVSSRIESEFHWMEKADRIAGMCCSRINYRRSTHGV